MPRVRVWCPACCPCTSWRRSSRQTRCSAPRSSSSSSSSSTRISPGSTDENCFFCAVGFRLFEQLLGSAEQLAWVRVKPSKEQMVGMPEFTVEDFYDNFMESLGQLGGEDKEAAAELDTMFKDEGVSNYMVVLLRYVSHSTSTSTLQFKLSLPFSGLRPANSCSSRGNSTITS